MPQKAQKASFLTGETTEEMLKASQGGLLTGIKAPNHTSFFIMHLNNMSVVSIKQLYVNIRIRVAF